MLQKVDTSINQTSILGILSIVIALFGILITLLILYICKLISGEGVKFNILFLVNSLNILSIIEIIIKAGGTVLAVIGIAQKKHKKNLPIFGLLLNVASITFTFLAIYVF